MPHSPWIRIHRRRHRCSCRTAPSGNCAHRSDWSCSPSHRSWHCWLLPWTPWSCAPYADPHTSRPDHSWSTAWARIAHRVQYNRAHSRVPHAHLWPADRPAPWPDGSPSHCSAAGNWTGSPWWSSTSPCCGTPDRGCRVRRTCNRCVVCIAPAPGQGRCRACGRSVCWDNRRRSHCPSPQHIDTAADTGACPHPDRTGRVERCPRWPVGVQRGSSWPASGISCTWATGDMAPTCTAPPAAGMSVHWGSPVRRRGHDTDRQCSPSAHREQIPRGRTCGRLRRRNVRVPCRLRRLWWHCACRAARRHTHRCTNNPRQHVRCCTAPARIRRPCGNVVCAQMRPLRHSTAAAPWHDAILHVADVGKRSGCLGKKKQAGKSWHTFVLFNYGIGNNAAGICDY